MSTHPSSLSSLRIPTNDMEKSSAWYEQLFSISPTEKLENFVAYQLGDLRLEVCLADEKSPSSTGGWCPYFKVSNMEAMLQLVSDLGGRLYRGPLYVEETNSTIAQVEDPSGNVLGFECFTNKWI